MMKILSNTFQKYQVNISDVIERIPLKEMNVPNNQV